MRRRTLVMLRGASAATLPVERAMRFELVVNQRAARAPGLALPSDVQVFAKRVIA